MWKWLLMSCIQLQFTFHDDERVVALLMEDEEARCRFKPKHLDGL